MRFQKFYEVECAIRDQADKKRKRKTIGLELLRKYVATRINLFGWWANSDTVDWNGYGWKYGDKYSNGERLTYYDGATDVLEDMLHLLDIYGGFNSRDWRAFCSHLGWHDVVLALQAYDDKHKTHHYWNLLRILDRSLGGSQIHYIKTWYSGYCVEDETLRPTDAERKRAKRILDRYARYFGIKTEEDENA